MRPTHDQLKALTGIRHHRHVVEYLQAMEQSYIDKMVESQDAPTVRMLQGSVQTLRTLLKLIHTE